MNLIQPQIHLKSFFKVDFNITSLRISWANFNLLQSSINEQVDSSTKEELFSNQVMFAYSVRSFGKLNSNKQINGY